jgi:hypothetical protein
MFPSRVLTSVQHTDKAARRALAPVVAPKDKLASRRLNQARHR